MTNNIGITWTSDQRALIKDHQDRIALLQKDIAELKKLAAQGTATGGALARGGKAAGDAYRQAGSEMDRLGRIAATSFQKSISPMDAHLKRLKEYRVLLRMGKIDADQFAKANQASLKKYYDDSGQTERLRKSKSDKDRAKRDADKDAADRKAADDKAAANRQKILDQQKAENQRLRDLRKKEMDAEIADRKRQVDQVLSISRSQYQRAYDEYQAFMVKIRGMRSKGELNDSQFRNAWNGAKDRFNDASGHTAQMKEGKRLLEQYSSAWDKYNAKLAKYRELLKAGAIDQRTFNKAVADSNPAISEFSQNVDKGKSKVGSMLTEVTKLAVGYVSLRGAIHEVMNANKESQRSAEAAIAKQTDLLMRYRAQGGLDKLRGQEAKMAIYKSAIATATTSDEAFGSAQAMVSTGFDPKDVEGGALTEFLKLLKAQALHPNKAVSPQEMAEAVSQFMTANDLAKTPQNMAAVAVAIQGLKATPLKLTDLPQLSEHSSTLKELGGLDWREQLALFSHLRGTESAEMSGTHLREVVRQLETERGSHKATEQLAKMGLQPEDVDFIGKDIFQVMRKLKEAVDKLPEHERHGAVDTLVEGRNISALYRIMNNQGDIDKLLGQTTDRKGFNADFGMTSQSRNAQSVRLDTAIEMKEAVRDMDSENDRKRMELETAGMSPAQRDLARRTYDFLDYFSGHDNHMMTFGTSEKGVEVGQRVIRRDDEMAALNQWIKEQVREVKNQAVPGPAAAPPINVNVQVNMPGQGEKPAPVPAAALGGG